MPHLERASRGRYKSAKCRRFISKTGDISNFLTAKFIENTISIFACLPTSTCSSYITQRLQILASKKHHNIKELVQ